MNIPIAALSSLAGASRGMLILLDADRLDRLQRFIAAFIFSAQVRHSVLHDEVIKWRARLGADAYKFALNGTKLLPRVERFELEEDA